MRASDEGGLLFRDCALYSDPDDGEAELGRRVALLAVPGDKWNLHPAPGLEGHRRSDMDSIQGSHPGFLHKFLPSG